MLKRKFQLSLIAAAVFAAGAAHAGDYVTSSAGPLRTSSGECVRTGYWSEGSDACDAKPVIAAALAGATAKLSPEPRKRMAAAQVFFPFDQAGLGEDALKSLDALVDSLRDSGVERVVAIGHADPIGTQEYNEGLSERRAEAVREYLVAKGMPAAAFRVEAKGEEQADASRCGGITSLEKRIACLQPDRRVEIEVFAIERAMP